jgi:serine protease Do
MSSSTTHRILALAALLGLAQQGWPESIPLSFSATARAIKPAVVNISTEKRISLQGFPGFGGGMDPFFGRFFQGQGQPQDLKQASLGSGVVIDAARAMVLTNNHVVERADSIKVKLADGREFEAKLVGTDPKTDLAVIQLKSASGLSAASWGDSEALEVGDWVVAVGSPFGLEQTVSHGIVSAKGRVIGAGPYDNFLQTDAAINPGNSGGPLVNLKGEVVGINTAISTESGGSEGVGFAIPSIIARKVSADLMAGGKVVRGWLGINIQELTPALARRFGLADAAKGVLVADVSAGGPAAKAGLKPGDVVLAFNGQAVAEPRELQRLVAGAAVGQLAKLSLWRDKAATDLSVKLGRMDDKEPGKGSAAGEGDAPAKPGRLGLGLRGLGEAERGQLGLKEPGGVLVDSVEPGSAAEAAGLKPGDVILELDAQRSSTAEALKAQADRLKPGQEAVLRVFREGHSEYLSLTVPKD